MWPWVAKTSMLQASLHIRREKPCFLDPALGHADLVSTRCFCRRSGINEIKKCFFLESLFFNRCSLFWMQLWDIVLSEHSQFIMNLIVPCARARAQEQMRWVSGHWQRHTNGEKEEGEKWDSSSLSLFKPCSHFSLVSLPRGLVHQVDMKQGRREGCIYLLRPPVVLGWHIK